MATKLSSAMNYVQAINGGDLEAFSAQFAEDAVVDDVGREFRDRPAIIEWAQREIFAAQVKLEVLEIGERDGSAVITTVVDGNFDRTGLPDPLVMEHEVQVHGDKIARLACRLATQRAIESASQ